MKVCLDQRQDGELRAGLTIELSPNSMGPPKNGAWNDELNVYLLGMNIMFMIEKLFFLKSIFKGES